MGESWRLAGKDANKPNSWGDLIACAQDMVKRGVTTSERLFIFGGSAGGIAIGRALTERPDLFAGALDPVAQIQRYCASMSEVAMASVPPKRKRTL